MQAYTALLPQPYLAAAGWLKFTGIDKGGCKPCQCLFPKMDDGQLGVVFNHPRDIGGMFCQLAGEVRQLHALVIVFIAVEAFAGELVAEREAAVFLCVEAFVLYLPPVPARGGKFLYIFRRGFLAAEPHKGCGRALLPKGLPVLAVTGNGFGAAEPVNGVSGVRKGCVYPAVQLVGMHGTLSLPPVYFDAAAVLVFYVRDVLLQGFEAFVLEHYDKLPPVSFAGLHKGFVGVQPVGQYAYRQAGEEFFKRPGQPREGLLLTVLLFKFRASVIGHPFAGQRYAKAGGCD